jgi:hypothetical protein
MAMGHFVVTSGTINTNATTDLITPASYESVYVYYVGIDVTAGGTTSSAKVKAQTTSLTLGHYLTTAVGHQESYFATSDKNYPGFQIPVGEKLQVVTAGAAAATLTVTVIYQVRGGAF